MEEEVEESLPRGSCQAAVGEGSMPSGDGTGGPNLRRPVREASLKLRFADAALEDSDDEGEGRPGAAQAGPSKWTGRHLVTFPGYRSNQPDQVASSKLTLEWMAAGHFRAPVLVVNNELERSSYTKLSVSYILQALGPEPSVRTIDVETQEDGPIMSLQEWCEYWFAKTSPGPPPAPGMPGLRINAEGARNSKHAKRLLNVVSLNLAGSELERVLPIPEVVRRSDLVKIAWPQGCAAPTAELYALMSPAGCYTDWHVDFGGSSVWYHVVSGKKHFALAPPTQRNLKAFAAWASSSKQGHVPLLAYLEDPVLHTMSQGQTMLIPGGWPHAVYTPFHSVVVGGNFLHPFNLKMQLHVWRLEDALGVPAKCRFPGFAWLVWYAAAACDRTMSKHASAAREMAASVVSIGGTGENGQVTKLRLVIKREAEGQRGNTGAGEDVSAPSELDPIDLMIAQADDNACSSLITTLRDWLARGSKADRPPQITDPDALLDTLEARFRLLGHMGGDCALDHVDFRSATLPEPIFTEENQHGAGLKRDLLKMAPGEAVGVGLRQPLAASKGKPSPARPKKSLGVRDRLKKKIGLR